eukprot:Tamp_07974.p2 GENE.Tamp_07974~~Tamp_07974.p2  ORF type:complete len:435 (-),score=32.43 Tamp_07974:200-1504(-)
MRRRRRCGGQLQQSVACWCRNRRPQHLHTGAILLQVHALRASHVQSLMLCPAVEWLPHTRSRWSTCVSRQQPRQVQPAQPPDMEARTLGCQTICHPARPIASHPSHLSQERQCAQSPPPLRPPPPRHGRLLHALPWRGPPVRPGKTLSAPPAYESASAGDLTEIKDHLLDILRSNRLADLPLSVPPPPPPCVPPPDYIPPPPPDPPPQSRPSQYLGEEHVEDAGVVHGFVYDEEYAFDRARDHHVASPVDDAPRTRCPTTPPVARPQAEPSEREGERAVTCPDIIKKARAGSMAGVRAILDRERASVHATDAAGTTVLGAAASNGHASVARLLLRKNAEINCRNSKGQTALHLALKYGYTDVAELLLEKGIDVQAVDAEGKSSLQLCNPRVYQSQIMQLNRMGVEDRDTVLLALLKAKGDVNAAIEELTRIGAL